MRSKINVQKPRGLPKLCNMDKMFKRDDFNFNIVNFPFLSSNIPQSPAYGVYVSQLIRYSRASSAYGDFLVRSRLLTRK